MQIIANPTSLFLPSNPLAAPKSITPELPNPESTSPASVLVNFTGPKEPPSTYEQPRLVDVAQVRNPQDKTENAAKITQMLSSDVLNLRDTKSPFSVSSFFNQIGTLSRETTQYKNEARSLQVLSTKASDKTALNFSESSGKIQAGVTLRIRTKDGDSIDVSIQHRKGLTGDSLEFSFDVTGDLSEAEQGALEKLAAKLGDVADDFFRTGTAQLHGLKEFDQTTLKDFRIEFSKAKTSDTYATMSYDYSIDEHAQTQHLSAKDADGYTLDISTKLQDLLGAINPSFHKSLENYLTIIRNSLNEHNPFQQEHPNSTSARFAIDAFTSILSPKGTPSDSPARSNTEKALSAFDTGLPDFTAVINAPLRIYKDSERQLEIPENMTLRLEQRTESEAQADGSLLIKQTNSFERQSREIEAIVGSDKGDLSRGNFAYRTQHEKQQTTRLLNIAETGINNLITEHTNSIENTLETFKNFHLEHTEKEEHKNRQLMQLTDEIKKYHALKQELEPLQYLKASKEKLFY